MAKKKENRKKKWTEPKLLSLAYKNTLQGITTANKEDDYNFNPTSPN